MLKSLTRIAPFLIVTLLSIAGVESFYAAVEYFFLDVSRKGKKQVETQVEQRKSPEEPHRYTNYDVIMQRNLFQSYAKEEVGSGESVDTPLEELQATSLDLVLMGTIIGNEKENRAIILDKKTNKQEIHYPGDYVQDAEIKKILRGKVVFGYQGRDEILDMSEATGLRRSSVDRPSIPGVNVAPDEVERNEPAMHEAVEGAPQSDTQQPATIQPRRRVVPSKIRRQEPFPPAPPPEEIQ